MTSNGTDLSKDFAERPGAAFVIGGSGGIGAAICVELARRGSDVALTYRVNEEAAGRVAAAVSEEGRAAWTAELDLLDHESCLANVDAISEAAGGLHTLVYAAGPHVPQRHLSKITPAEVQRQIDVDAVGFFAVVSAALPHLRNSQGSIVAVTRRGAGQYSATPIRTGTRHRRGCVFSCIRSCRIHHWPETRGRRWIHHLGAT